jgi:hypothetical protein
MSYWDGQQWVDRPARGTDRPTGVKSRFAHAGQAILEGTLIALLAVGLIASTAFAAKGGNSSNHGGGHHGGKGGTMTATVVVSPNPVPAYSTFQITGCGYTPDAGVQFNLYTATATAVWGATADSNGCLNTGGWANAPSSATLDVLEGSVTKVASTTFKIVSN